MDNLAGSGHVDLLDAGTTLLVETKEFVDSHTHRGNASFTWTTATANGVWVSGYLAQLETTLMVHNDNAYATLRSSTSDAVTINACNSSLQNFTREQKLNVKAGDITIPANHVGTFIATWTRRTVRHKIRGSVVFDGTWYHEAPTNTWSPRTLSSVLDARTRQRDVHGYIDIITFDKPTTETRIEPI